MVQKGWVALGHSFAITTPVPELTAYLTGLFGALPATSDPTHRYEVVGPDTAGRWEARRDGTTIEQAGTAPDAVALLLWAVNQGVIADASDVVLLHAGGVTIDDVAVLVPGDQEVGKTTLTTGLLRSGAGYLSDEAVGLDLHADVAHGYPKALSLDPGSWWLFPELRPEYPTAVRPFLPQQWQVPPRAVPGAEVVAAAVPGLVVLPDYRQGAPTTARRLRGAEGLLRLIGCVFPTPLDRPAVLARLARLLDHAPCIELTYGELGPAVAHIRAWVRMVPDPPIDDAATDNGETYRPADTTSPTPTATPLDPRSVLGPRKGVTRVTVDGETVLHVADTDELHRLNDVGARVWAAFDGSQPLDVVVAEVTSAAQPSEHITADVEAFVADLARLGLLVPTEPS